MFEAYKSKITGSTYLFAPANGLVFVHRDRDNIESTRMTKEDIDVYVRNGVMERVEYSA
ncbi:hypothetical protein V2H33_22125 [Escherichia coli]|uniref:hypothetical protein n=1 Tax=Escherichia coli TaxID=562 RepID=UPI002EC49B5A|nr:hypothetical protein [Escherichia coli]